jgi:thiol-disulfide isomerase/thioredoxin
MGTTQPRCLAALALLLLLPAAYGEKAPFALQLTDSTFNGTIASASSSTYVLVEFFASWCVRCERPQFSMDAGRGTRVREL